MSYLPKFIQVRDSILLWFDPKFKLLQLIAIGRTLRQRSRPESKQNAVKMEVEPEEEWSKGVSKEKYKGGRLYNIS